MLHENGPFFIISSSFLHSYINICLLRSGLFPSGASDLNDPLMVVCILRRGEEKRVKKSRFYAG